MSDTITDHESAVVAARAFAPAVAAGASARDAGRRLPFDEVAALSATGLLAVTVPTDFGGPGLGARTLAEVVAIVAAADPSLAQIPQSHFVFLDSARRVGSDVLQRHLFTRVLDGARIANAQTERGGKTVVDDATTLRRRDGRLSLSGTKFYATGAVFADILAVRALGPDGGSVVAYVPADAPGVTIDGDWDGFGQRTTSSGTVVFDDVDVDGDLVLDYTRLLATPSTYGTRAQLVHAAIDVGIARGALDAVPGLAQRARPWFEADVERAADDPLLVAQAGDLELAVRSAEALLRAAAERIEAADGSSGADAIAEAALATAAAKVSAGRAARRTGSELFDFGGTRTASDKANLTRFWRDARTHTLHDPERWKLQHLGHWAIDRRRPPSHGTL
ncbi:SfnB family sulfur acquisition oxidoreductase [Gordonia liuliyuniae]|uniref:Dibenzothiophene monooxygenase n=1 Tax=Gordonia liuliyuniae TaxID=2911517 RepID=A0ABS9IQC3_9ACTN|nr:SfnB family sulfur acquisition oxidoreductase [Gordonia liuliyuniae]MCF8587734.1 SfnB family sulfur acquisition oxidoreductase [Gordonia liuliyuniae]